MKAVFKILNIIMVDRGLIECCRRNNQPVLGKHIAYYAGMVVYSNSSRIEFLDIFNSEILLREVYKINEPATLNEIIQYNREQIEKEIPIVSVKDLDEYLLKNKIVTLERNVDHMKSLGKRLIIKQDEEKGLMVIKKLSFGNNICAYIMTDKQGKIHRAFSEKALYKIRNKISNYELRHSVEESISLDIINEYRIKGYTLQSALIHITNNWIKSEYTSLKR